MSYVEELRAGIEEHKALWKEINLGKVADLLGLPVGSSILSSIEPGIRSLQAEITRLQAEVDGDDKLAEGIVKAAHRVVMRDNENTRLREVLQYYADPHSCCGVDCCLNPDVAQAALSPKEKQ